MVKRLPWNTLDYPVGITKTMVRILFESDNIEVEKEVKAFPFVSLVADVGGVLGLFLGFNILMIWDFIHDVVKKMNMLFCIKHQHYNIA